MHFAFGQAMGVEAPDGCAPRLQADLAVRASRLRETTPAKCLAGEIRRCVCARTMDAIDLFDEQAREGEPRVGVANWP